MVSFRVNLQIFSAETGQLLTLDCFIISNEPDNSISHGIPPYGPLLLSSRTVLMDMRFLTGHSWHFANCRPDSIIKGMKFIDNLKSRFDAVQQKHAVLGFPVAVVKRYEDDQVGKQAALVTYYAFLALFPLILVFITVLSIIVSGNPELQTKISGRVFEYFPALGSQLQNQVQTLETNGFVLALQILALLYGARGLAAILQETFNNVWHVEKEHRPGFVGDNLRSFAMMSAVGAGIIIGTVVSYSLGSILDIGFVGSALLTILNLVITYGLFLAVFRLGTASRIRLRSLVLGAIIAGTGVLIVQHFGGYIMSYQLPKLSGTYGSFALALGMIFWIYLQAQVILYALTITAVRSQRDWPKKLFQDQD